MGVHAGLSAPSAAASPPLSLFLSDRKFLVCVCDVPEPKDRFNVDEFSELLVVNKPVIYISVSELLNTHKVGSHL